MDVNMMGNRLKDILEREKVSASKVSRDLGIDKSQLSKFLRGLKSISIGKLERIADYLGYDIQFVKRSPSRKGEKK